MRKFNKIVITFMLIVTMLCSPFMPSYATESDNFIGNIALFSYGFIPRNWMACEGQQLQVQDYTPLFSIIGATYGGNGSSTFNLPNLKNKAPKNMYYAICVTGQYGTNGLTSTVGNIELIPNRYVQMDQANSFLLCDGRSVSINTYQALYTLIGTTFGGDGVNNFTLPNLSLYSPINGYSYMIQTEGIYPTDRLSSDAFLGSFVLLPYKKSFNDALPCENQILTIAQNTALFSLIGVQHGGNGNQNFKIPYLSKHVPNKKFQYYIVTQGVYPSRP